MNHRQTLPVAPILRSSVDLPRMAIMHDEAATSLTAETQPIRCHQRLAGRPPAAADPLDERRQPALRRRLAEVAETFELSDTELLVVWLCSGGGRMQVELAAAIGISPAQMSGLVERLGHAAWWRCTARPGIAAARSGGRPRPARTLLSQAAEPSQRTGGLRRRRTLTESDETAALRQSLCERPRRQSRQAKGSRCRRWRLLARRRCAVSTGCSRTFYRRQADIDAYSLSPREGQASALAAAELHDLGRSAVAHVRPVCDRLPADSARRSDLAPAHALRR